MLLGGDEGDGHTTGLLEVNAEVSRSQRSLSTLSRVSSIGTLTHANTASYTLQQLCHLGMCLLYIY